MAADAHRPVLRRVESEERAHGLRAPGAHQPEDAQDLAAPDLEAGSLDHRRGQKPAHLEQGLGGGGGLAGGEERVHRPPDHLGDQLVVRGGGEGAAPHAAAVAQHRVGLCDLPGLLEEVADVDDGHSAPRQAPDHREEPLHVGALEAARGLVHEHHPGAGGDGPADLDHLPRGERQVRDARVRVDLGMAELGQHLARLPAGGGAVEEPPAGRLGSHEDVLGHREVGEERELLVDERDPPRPRVPGRGRRVGPASQLHGAAVRAQEAGQAGEQRALARSVLSDERVHLARPDLQAGPVQGHRGAEALRDPGETEGGGVVHSSTPHPIPAPPHLR